MHQIIILALALLCNTNGGHAAGLSQEMMEELQAVQSNMRDYSTADAVKGQAKEQRHEKTIAYKMESSVLGDKKSTPEESPPREVMEAFKKQLQDGTYRGGDIWLKNSEHDENTDKPPSRTENSMNDQAEEQRYSDVWLVNKELVEKSAAQQPTSQYLLRRLGQAKEQGHEKGIAYKMESSVLEDKESTPEELPPREVMEAFKKQLQDGTYRGGEIWLKNSENTDKPPSRDGSKKELEPEDSRLKASYIYEQNKMESTVSRDRNQLAETAKSELEGATHQGFDSLSFSNYYQTRAQSLELEDAMDKASQLESLLMARQKNLGRKLDLSQISSSGLVQLSTDTIKDVLQGAMEGLAAEARALAENEVCNFIADRLSKFGTVTTDPITLSVEETKTVNFFEIFAVPGGSSIPIPLEKIVFDCSSRALTIETRPYGRQTIIPEEMELANIAFALSVDLTDTNTLVITFSGEWTISGQQVDVQVVYTRETDQFDITATPTGVNINLISLANDLTGLEVPNPFGDALTFTSLVISGTIQSDKTITLSLKAASEVKIIYLIYHKPSQSRGQKMIAVDFSNFQLSSLISAITEVDISGVPYFGTLMTPEVGLTSSKENISGLPSHIFEDSPLLDLLTSSGETVLEGTWAAIKFDFFESPIKLRLQNSLKFTPLGHGLSVDKLISAIPGVDSGIPFDIKIISSVDIVSFALSSDPKKSLTIDLNYDDGLSFFNDLIEIDSATITLYLSRQPTKLRVEVSGDLTVGETSFTVSLLLDEDDDYFIVATADSLPISDALAQFHASVLPPEINSVLSDIPFVSFSLQDPRLVYPLSSVPQQIQIGGTPVIAGSEIATVEVLVIKERAGIILVEGFDIGRVNLADLIKTVTTFDLSGIPLLNHELEAAILISPKTLPDVHLHGEKLENFAITRGVSVQAEMGFPSDCSSDPFCAVAQSLLGESARLSLRGTMSSAERFELFAGVSDIRVGSGLTISNAGLEVEAGTDPSIGVIGSIILSNPPITLTSRIFLSPSGVVLSMSQSGCWNNAFGANWLSICNILGSVGIAPGVVISRLEVGGEIRLGNRRCSSPITATGFFGIDAVTPTNNYYYVQFTGPTTVSSLIRAFCVNVKLPRPLGESGFPNGFLSSFSVAGHELPHAGIVIPAGYRLKGTLNILGLQGFADITIGLPQGIDIQVALPVINVGNLLRMSRSARDTSHGPFLKAKIVALPSPKVDIEARGYVQVLGISVESTLRITNTQFEYRLSGRMLRLFDADLLISASYGSLSRASFRAKGHFRNSLYGKIESRIKQVLRDSANVATAHIRSAQDEVDRKHADFDKAVSALQSAQRDVNGANADFDSAEGALRRAREKVRSVCRIRSCGSVCVPCPTCCDCCGRVWGACVCYRPGWNSCCTRVPDPACHAANGICKGLIATAEGVLHAAEATVNTAQHSLKVAEGVLIAARHTVDQSRVTLHIANAALEAASATYKVGTLAAEKIASVGLNGLVSIREISFDVDLRQARSGSFSGSVRAKFLGHAEATVSLRVNLRDITSMAKQLAEQIGDGFSDLFS